MQRQPEALLAAGATAAVRRSRRGATGEKVSTSPPDLGTALRQASTRLHPDLVAAHHLIVQRDLTSSTPTIAVPA